MLLNILIQISNIFYDEVTHSDNEEQMWWLFSRLRSKAKNVHSIWMSANPQFDHWVLKYAMWYLYPEGHEFAGRPDQEKNGVIRYLLRIGGDVVWGDTAQELIDKYGKPDLPNDHIDQVKPISFMGLFGTIDDNPPLKLSNPLYKSNLEALPRLERERLLFGSWFARPEGSSYFKRESCPEIIDEPPASEFSKIIRAYDVAGTLPHDGYRSPDYFASVKMGKLKSGDYVILDVRRTRITFGEWEAHILENALRDGTGVDIVLPEDPNPASKAATVMLARSIITHGYVVKTRRAPAGKLDSFRPFAASCELGVVQVVKGCANDDWNKIVGDNDFFYNELERFDGKRRGGELGHDDMVDCCSLCFLYLAQRVNLPNITAALSSVNLTNHTPFN